MKSIDFDYASDNIIWGCIFTKTRKEIFLRPNNKIKWKVSYGSAVVTLTMKQQIRPMFFNGGNRGCPPIGRSFY